MLILGTATVWGFKGRLPTRAEGKGVVVRAGNLLTVSTLGQGQVIRVSVKVGDRVKPGQLVAEVGQPDLSNRMQAARAQLADAGNQANKQMELLDKSSRLELESSAGQRAAIEQQIEAAKQEKIERRRRPDTGL